MREMNYKMFQPADADGLSLGSMLRFVTSILGLVMVCFGGFGSIRLFFAVLAFVQEPAEGETLFAAWMNLLGAKDMVLMIQGFPITLAGPVTMIFLFLAVFLLLRLLIAVMKGGLSLLTWAKSERAAAGAKSGEAATKVNDAAPGL